MCYVEAVGTGLMVRCRSVDECRDVVMIVLMCWSDMILVRCIEVRSVDERVCMLKIGIDNGSWCRTDGCDDGS